MVQSRSTILALLVFCCFSAASAFATCHVVTPSGSGAKTGADWNNAYAGVPGTLTRGDVYYLADGNYGSFSFNTAASGTTVVTIRKAQSYDHCTDTGWDASTMGSAQAVFTRVVSINAPYFTLDGNGTQTTQGCGGAPGPTIAAAPPTPSDCGIKIDDSTCSANCITVVRPNSGPFTFQYVEFRGNSTPSANEDNFVQGSGSSPSTYNHIYGHNTGAVYFQYGCNQRTVENSYFWGTEVQGPTADGTHGQYSYCGNTDSNGVEAHNIYRDITGTAVWTFAFPQNTHTGWVFYDNIIWSTNSALGTLGLGWTSDGALACINSGSNCNNFAFYQNTFVNTYGGTGINNENTGSYIVEDNIWYGTSGPSFNTGSGGSYTLNHNSFLNTGSGCPSGTANVCDNSAPNPFTNWPGNNPATNPVFTLASDNADWNNELALSSPYNTDAAGNTFTTDRGAYQYEGGTSKPQPPTGLAASVN